MNKLSHKLLREYHERKVVKGQVFYHPKTGNAGKFWMNTGVCPNCHTRAITMENCLNCEWHSSNKCI